MWSRGNRPGHRPGRMPVLLVLALVAALALGGWAVLGGPDGDDAAETAETLPPTDEPDPAPTPEPTPDAPRPQVGDCRVLGWNHTDREVTDAGSQPTPCVGKHNAQTVATGLLDGRTGLDPAADPERLVDAVSLECRTALVDWLGGDEDAYELSMYAYVVAVPTAEDLEAGARWWRCDTYATEREGRLAPLPSSTEDVLAGDGADQWATCVQGALGPEPRQVMCREQHDWRAISAHRLGESTDEFPGSEEVGDEIRSTCQAAVRAYVDDPLDGFDYGWLRPTGPDWRDGQRFGLCFTQTSS